MNSSLRNLQVRKFLSEELLAANKYSEVSITRYRHSHHDEMKTSTEYRKRKHKITQERRWTD